MLANLTWLFLLRKGIRSVTGNKALLEEISHEICCND